MALPSDGGTDWERITGEWVRDGLIEEAQRAPLLARLISLPVNSRRGGPFGEAAVMALVLVGVLLVTSSLVVALVLFEVPDATAALIVTVLGVLQGAAGAGTRFVVHRSIGHGLGGAGAIVFSSGLFGLGVAERALEPVCLALGLLAFLAVSLAAVADEGRGLAGAAAFGGLAPALSQIGGTVPEALLFFGALAYTLSVAGGVVVAERLELPNKLEVLAVQAPFAAFVASCAVLLHRPVLLTGAGGKEWESALLLGLFGGLSMIAGWASGSRYELVSGLGVLLVAQVPVLAAYGSALLGIAVLGFEGIALIVVAVLALVVRVRREQRALLDT